jgi:DNA-binding transcriptional regulator YiaG
MIRNEREYRASLAHRRRLLAARAAHEAAPQAEGEAQAVLLAGVAELLGDVEAELAEYEGLRRGETTALEVADLAALPDALVRARIAAGLTQHALAARLGVSEEQVRKDEAGGYARASLARLAGVLAALGVAYRAPLTLEVGRAHQG